MTEEMERQLQRPLTPEERHYLMLYLEATEDEESRKRERGQAA